MVGNLISNEGGATCFPEFRACSESGRSRSIRSISIADRFIRKLLELIDITMEGAKGEVEEVGLGEGRGSVGQSMLKLCLSSCLST